MLSNLSSLSLQWNTLTGSIPEEAISKMRVLRGLQLEGNTRITGKIERHGHLCRMRKNYVTADLKQPKRQAKGELKLLTATCTPPSGNLLVAGRSDTLECDCCSECFGY